MHAHMLEANLIILNSVSWLHSKACPVVFRGRYCSQARQIESELEAKTTAFGKLCSGYDGAHTGRGESGLAAEQV